MRFTFVAACCLVSSVICVCAQDGLWESRLAEGRRLQGKGHYSEARDQFRAALQEAEKFGPENLQVASSLDNLGEVSEHLGLYAEAERFYRRSMLILEKKLGTGHVSTSATLSHLAGMYAETDRLAKAEPLLRRALAIRIKSLGPYHVAAAELFNQTGIFDQLRGKTAEAEQLYRQALDIFQKQLGPTDPWVATVLSNLACLAAASGRDEEALAYAERSWQIYGTLPNASPASVKALAVLGVVYSRTDHRREAEPYIKRALAISENSSGPESLSTARILRDYAYVLRRLKRKREAGQMEKRAELILTNSARENGYGHTVDISAFLPH